MLRLRLDLDDLARIRLAPTGIASVIEAVYSCFALRQADSALRFGGWAARVRPRLAAAMAPLFELFHTPEQVPLFMIKRTDDPAVFAEHLLALPTERIREELTETGPYARLLAGGDRAARRELAGAVAGYHGAFADTVPAMRAVADADLAYRGSVLANDGLGRLLNSLHPGIRWRSPVLEVVARKDHDIALAGRDLWLIPAVFLNCWPGVLVEPDAVFVTYPVRGSLRLGGEPDGGDALVDLLGRTRAATLRALSTGRTTTELADRLGISRASASEHAAVLRRARLITTYREGRSVRHQLTTLGRTVLAGGES